MEEKPILGEETHINLGDTSPFTLPWVKDPFGKERPPLSIEAMRLSVELAANTYAMNVDPWINAGWQDITIQVDGDLTSGVEPADNKPFSRLSSAWKMYRVRSRIQQKSPLGQMVGALRQIEKSDTGKGLVMCHPTEDGRYIVAISFMGTGARLYDWFSNFRMVSEDGMHKGFLQLTRQFEDNEASIAFPQTAKELGMENLTLKQILQEAQQEDSRFVLWLVGHSQGAAIMQVYCHHKMKHDGVLPRNIVGYGFAPPSVAIGPAIKDPAAYPLYSVVNSDDLIPRMGSEVHLGMLLIYFAGEDIRRQCYPWPRDEASVHNRMAVRPMLVHMTDTAGCIETSISYFRALSQLSPQDILTILRGIAGKHAALQKMLVAADGRLDAVLRFLCRHLASAYQSITGHDIDELSVSVMEEKIAATISTIGLKPFNNALMELMLYPHTCVRRSGALMGSYPYITLFGTDQLKPMVWRSGRPPLIMSPSELSRTSAGRTMAPLHNRHKALAIRKNRSTRSYSSQRRTSIAARRPSLSEHAQRVLPTDDQQSSRRMDDVTDNSLYLDGRHEPDSLHTDVH